MEIKKTVIAALILLVFSCQKKNKPKSVTEIKNNTSLSDTLIAADSNLLQPKSNTEVEKKSVAETLSELTKKGFKTFTYTDPKTQDTVIMQQYFMAFLKSGPIRNQNEEEAKILQEEHLAHLQKMYNLGFADISGPFGDDSSLRGITIYNVPTKKLADSLANADPMVQAGRLEIEIHPWWAAKGFGLR